MKSRHLLTASAAALCALTVPTHVHANAIAYTVTVLELLPGGISSYPTGVNNAGQVVGRTLIGTSTIATIWNGTSPTGLGLLLGGTASGANGINNSGQVVGTSNTAATSTQATIWNGITPTALQPLGSFALALGINSSGQMAGYTASGGNFRALFWNSASATPVVLGTRWSIGNAINESGQVAGASGNSGGDCQATVWNGTTPTILGMPTGAFVSVGYAVNNSADVAGY
jgi:probable HAF family extracellular repeat protein